MKKWLMMLAVLVTFCLVGCGEKPMTAVYFQADDNSWYFADLDTGTIFSGTIPDKLTDENGKKLTEEDMTDGDVYLIMEIVSCWKASRDSIRELQRWYGKNRAIRKKPISIGRNCLP